MDKKELANNYFRDGKYDEAINLYTDLLKDDENNYIILSNRSACYIKQEKYNLGLTDAVKSTKLKSNWGKSWGRVGASLFGLKKYEEALVAYHKANELEPLDIYKEMINQIENKLKELKGELLNENFGDLTKNYPVGDLVNNLFDYVISNPKIIEKLNDPTFQSKVLSFENNPLNALKDNDIMDLMGEMMKGIKL